MTKKERWLTKFIFFMAGIIVGFLLAPAKNGYTLTCGNNNRGSLSMRIGCKIGHGKKDAAHAPDETKQ